MMFSASQVTALVQKNIAIFIANGQVFTAYDVTKTIREAAKDYVAQHAVIKAEVEREATNQGLTWTLIDIDTAQGTMSARVFHFPNQDPLTHPKSINKPQPQSQAQVQASSAPSLPAIVNDDGTEVVVELTSEDRLTIPRFLSKNLSLNVNEPVSLSSMLNGVAVHAGLIQGCEVNHVNADGRIRISGTWLQKMLNTNSRKFKLTYCDNSQLQLPSYITIEAA